VLDAINYVTLFNYEVHGELGDTPPSRRSADALTEFQAALKLNPPDKACLPPHRRLCRCSAPRNAGWLAGSGANFRPAAVAGTDG
jgi:hypothetical protein